MICLESLNTHNTVLTVWPTVHTYKDILKYSFFSQGYHGIKEEVFLSLPVIVGETGITHTLNQDLSQDEKDKLLKGADKIQQAIDTIVW